jgi:VCBS repeat-containing protein
MTMTVTLNTLISFEGFDGANPFGGLIADAAGDLFGTTEFGGTTGATGLGTVFEIVKTASGYASTPTVLVSFSGPDGANPQGDLIADAAGDLFGTTFVGGAGVGTVFEITGSGFVVATPTAVADRTGVNVGAFVTTDAAHGVLANDTDPIAGDTLHVSAVNGQAVNNTITVAGTFGTLTLNADGSYTYSAPSSDILPASGVAQDVFTYTASTGQGGTATSTLTVTVTAAGLNYIGGAPGSTITGPGGHSPVLDGGAGNNTLVASNGATVLIGGPGDTLTGGKGADTYVFTGNFGQNTITNYNANKDIVELDQSQFTSLAAVQAATHQVGANTVITVDAAGTITLTGVSLSQLHFDASHFLLV